MDPDSEVTCPDCDASFYLVWNRGWETEGGPSYCPFCGYEGADLYVVEPKKEEPGS